MDFERKELAGLFACYLSGSLFDDGNIDTWDRLGRSKDETIINGCQILADQIDDLDFDAELLDKSEWDYLERVRLALSGNATIVKHKSLRFGWRNVVSGLCFFVFVAIAVHYGWGYHLLPVTFLIGIGIFAYLRFFPEEDAKSPYERVLNPFRSFSDIKTAHNAATSFKKIRYTQKQSENESSLNECFWMLFVGFLMATTSPLLLLALAFPNAECKYEAVA